MKHEKNQQEIGLCEIRPGELAAVSRIMGEGPIRRRLCDVGLIEGTVVHCIGKSPAGDPAAYLIRGAVIAIRKKDARNVRVVRTPPPKEVLHEIK